MEEYEIIWRGGFTYNEVIENQGYDNKEVIYAITHEPFNRHSTTGYIGMAYHQNIGTRLNSDHRTEDYLFNKYGETNIRYYLGRVVVKYHEIRGEKRLSEIEFAMIYFHFSIEYILEANTKNASSYEGRNLRILNKGNVPPKIKDFEVENGDWREIERSSRSSKILRDYDWN